MQSTGIMPCSPLRDETRYEIEAPPVAADEVLERQLRRLEVGGRSSERERAHRS